MLRSAAGYPKPTVAHGSRAEIETKHLRHQSYAEGTDPGRALESREPSMTFELDDAATPMRQNPRFAALANQDTSYSPNHLQHLRQQSAPILSPLRSNNNRPHSPVRDHARHQSQGMPFTGDSRGGRRQENSPGRFAGWLNGTSTSSVDDNASPDTTPRSKRGTPLETTPKSATQSRFGFLASSVSAFTTRLTTANQTTITPQVDDELCNIDVDTVLCPASPSDYENSFSPASYKNLHMNASGLLHKMQDAYRQRTQVLQEIQAEREAQREETEEAELRVRHFKNQLEKMAAKAAQQEGAMQQLMAELQAERRARYEERVARDKILAEGSSLNEDLCVDEEERKRWRTSGGTDLSSANTTDTDGESESIFSRSRSPTAPTSATPSTIETESVSAGSLDVAYPHPHHHHSNSKVPTLHVPRPPSLSSSSRSGSSSLTTFQKLVKGISGDTVREGQDEAGGGCRNCKGQDASVAWDTVSLLRDENKGLKQRVAQLEVVVEGALDVVNGITIQH
ncbi:hypothetical protein F4778DRAFT_738668 [Xylariomycetidae sp. FL2044]|nr:hypothetical protein F4778DRAFT_738668 [Xylariomycetidae sp. FL2044]